MYVCVSVCECVCDAGEGPGQGSADGAPTTKTKPTILKRKKKENIARGLPNKRWHTLIFWQFIFLTILTLSCSVFRIFQTTIPKRREERKGETERSSQKKLTH